LGAENVSRGRSRNVWVGPEKTRSCHLLHHRPLSRIWAEKSRVRKAPKKRRRFCSAARCRRSQYLGASSSKTILTDQSPWETRNRKPPAIRRVRPRRVTVQTRKLGQFTQDDHSNRKMEMSVGNRQPGGGGGGWASVPDGFVKQEGWGSYLSLRASRSSRHRYPRRCCPSPGLGLNRFGSDPSCNMRPERRLQEHSYLTKANRSEQPRRALSPASPLRARARHTCQSRSDMSQSPARSLKSSMRTTSPRTSRDMPSQCIAIRRAGDPTWIRAIRRGHAATGDRRVCIGTIIDSKSSAPPANG